MLLRTVLCRPSHVLLAGVAAAAILAGAAQSGTATSGTTYYVSPSGNDANRGTSPQQAWRTVARTNSADLHPGDTVLFEGGRTFAGRLWPTSSGAASAPIVFGSYGSGRASLTDGIVLESVHDLTFSNLAVDGGDWRVSARRRGVYTKEAPSSGARGIAVQNCVFQNVSFGLLITNPNDSDWVVRNNQIRNTGDSGILIFDALTQRGVGGSNMLFEGNTILDTGLDYATLRYPLHGIYDKGRNVTIRDNVIRRFQNSGISARARKQTIVGNTISDGLIGISYGPDDAGGGLSTLAYNTISDVGGKLDLSGLKPYGIVIYGDAEYLSSNPESFVIANNTIANADAGIRVAGTRGSVTLANNLVNVDRGVPLTIDSTPRGGLSETHDLLYARGRAPGVLFRGTPYGSASSYRKATGLGAGDVFANPLLDASYVPSVRSPVVDAGTTAVLSVSYLPNCRASHWDYCGQSVDMGSVELVPTVQSPWHAKLRR